MVKCSCDEADDGGIHKRGWVDDVTEGLYLIGANRPKSGGGLQPTAYRDCAHGSELVVSWRSAAKGDIKR